VLLIELGYYLRCRGETSSTEFFRLCEISASCGRGVTGPESDAVAPVAGQKQSKKNSWLFEIQMASSPGMRVPCQNDQRHTF